MFHHIIVGTNDIERAKKFYDAVLATLGAPEGVRNLNGSGQTRVFYTHGGDKFGITQPIDGQPATVSNGATVAFDCNSPEQAMAFHAAGVAHGGQSIEAPPGWRETPNGKTFLAYVRDPDGNKLGAIHKPS